MMHYFWIGFLSGWLFGLYLLRVAMRNSNKIDKIIDMLTKGKNK